VLGTDAARTRPFDGARLDVSRDVDAQEALRRCAQDDSRVAASDFLSTRRRVVSIDRTDNARFASRDRSRRIDRQKATAGEQAGRVRLSQAGNVIVRNSFGLFEANGRNQHAIVIT